MTITAPYNFVPLSNQVAFANEISPDLAGVPSQDMPHPGSSESGVLKVTLTAHTPFLVSKSKGADDKKAFFRDPHGNPALPGSSWRGAIRNVLEIATFGQMRLVADQRTGMRDLNAVTDYRDHFTDTTSTRSFASKVEAAWMEFKDGQVALTPCDFGRVDHRDTLDILSIKGGRAFRDRIDDAIKTHRNQHTRTNWERPGQTPRPTDTTIAETVQRIFLEGSGSSLSCSLHVENHPTDHTHSDGKLLRYRKARCTPMKESSAQDGVLVFTGMPSPRKHMEFFFYNEQAPRDLDRGVFELFLAVHEEQEKESPTWAWRKEAFYRGERIPVFYLSEGSKIKQIGLSMMFKMAGDNSVHALIGNTSKAHLEAESDERIDLATRIFGRIGGKGKSNNSSEAAAFRSRVSFGWGRVVPNTFEDGNVATVHLQRPKVGYFPAYIRQRDLGSVAGDQLVRSGGNKPVPYRTYMNWQDKPKNHEEIRGWKRYPVLTTLNTRAAAEGSEASKLVPLVAGPAGKPSFVATLRYHNLHPIELGALLWAITRGGNRALRHSMGMGRPLGWGQIEAEAELDERQKAALLAFQKAMEAWATKIEMRSGWSKSLQMLQLQAMANPVIGDSNKSKLRQMVLAPDQNVNDFIQGKKEGSILPEYALDDVSPWLDGPDSSRIKGANQLNANQQGEVREAMKAARSNFDTARKDREEQLQEQDKKDKGKESVKAFADLFPPESRVFVDGVPKVRIVKAVDGNGYRLISRRADGTGGPDRVKVSRLAEAP